MASAAQAENTSRSVRATLWILLIVYIFNFIDRQIVNILAEPIAIDLGLSDTQIGLMTGLAFALFSAWCRGSSSGVAACASTRSLTGKVRFHRALDPAAPAPPARS